jgi:hypothetical protein
VRNFNNALLPYHFFHFLDFSLFDGNLLDDLELDSSFVEHHPFDNFFPFYGNLYNALLSKVYWFFMNSGMGDALLNHNTYLVLNYDGLLHNAVDYLS